MQRPSGEVSLQPSVEHQNRIGVSSFVCVVGGVGGGICTWRASRIFSAGAGIRRNGATCEEAVGRGGEWDSAGGCGEDRGEAATTGAEGSGGGRAAVSV